MSTSKLSILYRRYLIGDCSENEIAELEYYFNHPSHELELKKLMSDTWEDLSYDKLLTMDDIRSKQILEQILIRRSQSRRNLFARLAIAASILFAISGLIGYWYVSKSKLITPTVVKAIEIKPASSKATLTLGDGKKIILEHAEMGKLASQSGVNIVKEKSGQVVYVPQDSPSKVPVMNKIDIPRGGKFQVVLPDNSVVYLNSASSLSFPSVFTGNERVVNLTGEAYFEVAKNAKMPFKVKFKNNRQTVEVLGTHFNIKAYDDEGTITTTLVEGSVKVVAADQNVILKPGQEAFNNGYRLYSGKADVEVALAWQKGFFIFDNENIVDMMRKLEKWYDVDVEFVGDMRDINILGNYSSNKSLSNLLKPIAATKKVDFKIEGRRVTVIAK